MTEQNRDSRSFDHASIDEHQLDGISAGRTTQAGTDLSTRNDGSEVAYRESLEAAGLEVVVAAASI